MPYSHHSHSGQFCKHASGTLEQVIVEAIKQGFEVYGLTEHVPRYRVQDLYPEEEGTSLQDLETQFDNYLKEAHRLKKRYDGEITVLVGLETEFINELDLEKLENLLHKYGDRIEYLVGSVHHVKGIPIDFDLPSYERALETFPLGVQGNGSDDAQHSQMESFMCSYFDAQYELLQRFHPEVVGHIDLCRLYTPSLRFQDYKLAWEKLKRNIRFAIDYNALFELNASALRKGWDGSYPGEDVLQLIVSMGGHFALSDDSHGPHVVGLNYGRMRDYIRRMGITELWTLIRTDGLNDGGRYMHPRRIEGNWWEHAFWEHV